MNAFGERELVTPLGRWRVRALPLNERCRRLACLPNVPSVSPLGFVHRTVDGSEEFIGRFSAVGYERHPEACSELQVRATDQRGDAAQLVAQLAGHCLGVAQACVGKESSELVASKPDRDIGAP